MPKITPAVSRELAAKLAAPEAPSRLYAPSTNRVGSTSVGAPPGNVAVSAGSGPTSYVTRADLDVDARAADVREAPSLEALSRSPGFEPVFQEYLGVLRSTVPAAHLESAEDLRRWVKDPEDSFNISPILRGGKVVGGAHTQIPQSPEGAARENRVGSLEFAVGNDSPAVREAVRSGIRALGTSARNRDTTLDGIFADVPVGTKVGSEMAKALRSEGFELFYQGRQPPLEEGKPAQEVQIFYRPMQAGELLTREKAETYFDAYWSSFASLEGDAPLSRLQQRPEYQQLRAHLERALPSERVPRRGFELGSS